MSAGLSCPVHSASLSTSILVAPCTLCGLAQRAAVCSPLPAWGPAADTCIGRAPSRREAGDKAGSGTGWGPSVGLTVSIEALASPLASAGRTDAREHSPARGHSSGRGPLGSCPATEAVPPGPVGAFSGSRGLLLGPGHSQLPALRATVVATLTASAGSATQARKRAGGERKQELAKVLVRRRRFSGLCTSMRGPGFCLGAPVFRQPLCSNFSRSLDSTELPRAPLLVPRRPAAVGGPSGGRLLSPLSVAASSTLRMFFTVLFPPGGPFRAFWPQLGSRPRPGPLVPSLVFSSSLWMVAATLPQPGAGLSLAISRPTSRFFLRGPRPVPMNLARRSWKRVGCGRVSWGTPQPCGGLGGSPAWASHWLTKSSRLLRMACRAGWPTARPSFFFSWETPRVSSWLPAGPALGLWGETVITGLPSSAQGEPAHQTALQLLEGDQAPGIRPGPLCPFAHPNCPQH